MQNISKHNRWLCRVRHLRTQLMTRSSKGNSMNQLGTKLTTSPSIRGEGLRRRSNCPPQVVAVASSYVSGAQVQGVPVARTISEIKTCKITKACIWVLLAIPLVRPCNNLLASMTTKRWLQEEMKHSVASSSHFQLFWHANIILLEKSKGAWQGLSSTKRSQG